MLQIKSFGTKGDCCQATQPERGYRSNQSDLKLDLRNGVAIVVGWRACTHTSTSTSTSLSRSTSFKVQSPNANEQKMQSTTEMSSCGTNNKLSDRSRGGLKIEGGRG